MTTKKSNNQSRTNEHRLTYLETLLTSFMKEVKDDVRNIKDNHLEKIYKKLDEIKETERCLEKKIYQRPGWMIAGLCSLSVGLIIYVITLP